MEEKKTQPAPCRYIRWETATRWYEVIVMQDLFADWTVTRLWGGKGAKAHGQRVEIAESWDAAQIIVDRIHQRRIKRHPPYVLIRAVPPWQDES